MDTHPGSIPNKPIHLQLRRLTRAYHMRGGSPSPRMLAEKIKKGATVL
jgi:hypothetical protein